MGLQHELDALKAQFERTAPAGRAALYARKIEELRETFAMENAVGLGMRAPGFELPDQTGKGVGLKNLLSAGPVVLTFYRGGWCVYCNLQLRAYQTILPQIHSLGAELVAISPQLPDASLSTAEKNALTFPVLSDRGNKVARDFGLVWAQPEELKAALRSNGLSMEVVNGDGTWEVPVPATYVVAPDGCVALASIDVEYRNRLEPDAIVAALKSLQSR